MRDPLKALDALALQDSEALRLVLLGTSVIDWQRLAFTQRHEVDHFLRLCRFDPGSPADQAWMRGVIHDAADYLRDTFRYRVPPEVAQPAEAQELFLFASGSAGPRLRKSACIVLKVCHVIHHIEGRDLFHRLPLSEEDFGAMAEERVRAIFGQMRDAGLPIREAQSSAKSRASVISKLLQKAETLAAEVYDRTRFRVVVAERADVLPMLRELTQRLFPFHLVVPGQSHNSLIDSGPEGRQRQGEHNALSGSTYQMLKFVVDMPLRIEDRHISAEIRAATRARIVHCLVEFQVVDEATAVLNEQGDNEHERYKRRQRLKILRRLSRGSG
jgi:hypothetical protein